MHQAVRDPGRLRRRVEPPQRCSRLRRHEDSRRSRSRTSDSLPWGWRRLSGMACFRSSSDGGDGGHSHRYCSYSVTIRACDHRPRRFGADSARRQIGSNLRDDDMVPDVTPDELQVQFFVTSRHLGGASGPVQRDAVRSHRQLTRRYLVLVAIPPRASSVACVPVRRS